MTGILVALSWPLLGAITGIAGVTANMVSNGNTKLRGEDLVCIAVCIAFGWLGFLIGLGFLLFDYLKVHQLIFEHIHNYINLPGLIAKVLIRRKEKRSA